MFYLNVRNLCSDAYTLIKSNEETESLILIYFIHLINVILPLN